MAGPGSASTVVVGGSVATVGSSGTDVVVVVAVTGTWVVVEIVVAGAEVVGA